MPAKIIDDADNLRVTKDGKWDIGGGLHDFNGTISSTQHVGNSITVNFNGAYIVVYGRIDTASEGAVANFSIDGTPPEQITMPAFVGDVPMLRQQLWIKKGLAAGTPHTLRVTMDKIRLGTIGFDYFQVDNSDSTIATVTQWNLTGWPQPPSSSSQGGSSHLRLPAGGIVGIVIGCLCLLLGAVILWTSARLRAMSTEMSPTAGSNEKRHSNVMRSFIDPFFISQRTPDETMDSSHSTPAFDRSLFVSGPPARGNQKLAATTQYRDSAPHTARSRSGSIGASSSGAASSPSSLPPGARPPALVIPKSDRSLDLRRRAGGSTTVVSDEEEDNNSSPPSPQQHVDSGVREPEVILAHSSRQKRVELPPVYSAT